MGKSRRVAGAIVGVVGGWWGRIIDGETQDENSTVDLFH